MNFGEHSAYLFGFLILAVFVIGLLRILYKSTQITLLEYMLTLIAAGVPIGFLLKLQMEYLDEKLSAGLLGLLSAAVILLGSVKGLRWIKRREWFLQCSVGFRNNWLA